MNQQGKRATLGIVLAVMVLGVGWGTMQSRTPAEDAMQSRTPAEDAMQSRTPIEVAALGPQVGEQVPAFSLPDQNGQVRTLESILGPNGHIGTPFPGTFMVDRTGRVTSRFYEGFYRERNTTANVMLKLGFGLSPIAAIKGSTAHLKLTAYPSDPYVIPGTRFSVAVEVEPNPGIHVYAPGAEAMGYRVVSLNLEPPPHVRFEPVDFPASEIYYFEPLDERVPVYQSPFTLLQEAVVEASIEAEEALSQLDALTLSGTFDYQACNDVLCFEPVSLPLSFTLDLELLDYQRVSR